MDHFDAFLGAGEWNRKASSGFRFYGVNDQIVKLVVVKKRVPVPFSALQLRRNQYGFFEIDLSDIKPKQALALWPNLPGVNGTDGLSIRAVCREIGKILCTKENTVTENTVYAAYKREKTRGVAYTWLGEGE